MVDAPWGAGDIFRAQDQWREQVAAQLGSYLPPAVPGAEATLDSLKNHLSIYGGALSYLNTTHGLRKGKILGLKQSHERAMNMAKGRIPASAKLTTEAAKEAYVYNQEDSEPLKVVFRAYTEMEAVAEAEAGLIAAYKNAWETTSRLMTALLGETELASHRAGG